MIGTKYDLFIENFKVNSLTKKEKYYIFWDREKIKILKENIKYYYKVKKFEEGRLDNIIYKVYGSNNNKYKFAVKVVNNILNEFLEIKEGTILLLPDKNVIDNI